MPAHSLTPRTAAWLASLRAALQGTRLDLDVPGVEESRRGRDQIVGQIEDYLLPRISSLDAPLLAVLGGSTGSGKSTLMNSLVGRRVSTTGVLRPTTRSPVLVCHPDDVAWFADERVFPGLARVTGDGSAAGAALVLTPVADLPSGVALLDSPDIDSVEKANRTLAAQLLAAADLWLFVTTAARYADAVPWEFLEQARDRSTALALVLNRVPPGAGVEVAGHLAEMLDARGLDGVRIFTLEETELVEQALPEPAIAPIRGWLDDLAADAGGRARVIRQTLEGALATLPDRVAEVVRARDVQVEVAGALDDTVTRAYRTAVEAVDEGLRTGTLLRGEVLQRWQDLVGTGDFMRGLQARIGRFRDRVSSWVTGRDPTEAEVRGQIESSVGRLILAEADQAALRCVEAWEDTRAGRALLDEDARALSRSSADLQQRVAAELRDWERDVLDLVRGAGEEKRLMARALSLGINTVGVALMIVAFAHTGGLTGLEVGVAGGTATVSQTLLTALFGEQAVRSLAAQARGLLMQRVQGLMATEAERFRGRVEAARGEVGSAASLRTLGETDT